MEACTWIESENITRLDFRELGIQIHKPNIPKGEPYILIKLPLGDDFKDLRFYPQTGTYRIITGDVDESYLPEEISEDPLVKQELDELLNCIAQSQEIDAW